MGTNFGAAVLVPRLYFSRWRKFWGNQSAKVNVEGKVEIWLQQKCPGYISADGENLGVVKVNKWWKFRSSESAKAMENFGVVKVLRASLREWWKLSSQSANADSLGDGGNVGVVSAKVIVERMVDILGQPSPAH